MAAVTFAVTLIASPALHWGVGVGVLLALSHFLYWRMHPRIIEVGLHADGRLRDRKTWGLSPIDPHTYMVRMDAALDFGSAAALEQAIVDYLAANPEIKRVVLLAHAFNRIDATGVATFGRLRGQLAQDMRELIVVGLKLPVERRLVNAGYLARGDFFKTYVTEAEMIASLNESAIS